MRKQEYRTPENIEEEMKREVHLSFFGFTVFDIGHIILSVFMLIWALSTRGEGYEEDIAEAIILLVFAALLFSFVDGLVERHISVKSFRRFYSYAFLCATASLLVPLAIAFPKAVQFQRSVFVWDLMEMIAFFTTTTALVFFFVSLFFRADHANWRFTVLVGIVFFFIYVPLMVIVAIVREPFGWMTIVRIIHFSLPAIPGIIGVTRMARRPENSVLY